MVINRLSKAYSTSIVISLVVHLFILQATFTSGACSEGYYTDSEGQCIICPAGYYCADGIDTVLCGTGSGYYCPEGSANYTLCPIGYYCRTPDQIQECPEAVQVGYYCPAGSIIFEGCPKGYYCPDPTTLIECSADVAAKCTTSGLYSVSDCPAGQWCLNETVASLTEFRTPCDEAGDFCKQGTLGAVTKCPAGSYCQTPVDLIPCSEGSYCPTGSVEERNCLAGYYCPDSTQEIQCSNGTYCPEKSTTENPCSAGSYCPTSEQIIGCGRSFYCPQNSTVQESCPAGFYCPNAQTIYECESPAYCPIGSTTNDSCPAGNYCPNTTVEIPCVAGDYCPEGSTFALNCSRGFYCPLPSSQLECTEAGQYCPERSTTLQECPTRHYCPSPSSDFIECSPELGHFCPGSNSFPENCSAGFECSDTAFETSCATGTYCPEGTYIPTNCPEGYYCTDPSQIQACSITSYCPEGSTEENLCDAQYYCPNTTTRLECRSGEYCPSGTIEGQDCPAGFYCPTTSTKILCNQSTEGYAYCPPGQISRQLCATGYYCPSTTEIYACAPGTYCPEGQNTSQICSLGSFCPVDTCTPESVYGTNVTLCEDGTVNGTSIVSCDPGFYCEEGSILQTPCEVGFYCPSATEQIECQNSSYCPEQSSSEKACSQGYFCTTPKTQELCPPGTYAGNINGSTKCDNCPVNKYCPGSGTKVPKSCPTNSISLEGSANVTSCQCDESEGFEGTIDSAQSACAEIPNPVDPSVFAIMGVVLIVVLALAYMFVESSVGKTIITLMLKELVLIIAGMVAELFDLLLNYLMLITVVAVGSSSLKDNFLVPYIAICILAALAIMFSFSFKWKTIQRERGVAPPTKEENKSKIFQNFRSTLVKQYPHHRTEYKFLMNEESKAWDTVSSILLNETWGGTAEVKKERKDRSLADNQAKSMFALIEELEDMENVRRQIHLDVVLLAVQNLPMLIVVLLIFDYAVCDVLRLVIFRSSLMMTGVMAGSKGFKATVSSDVAYEIKKIRDQIFHLVIDVYELWRTKTKMAKQREEIDKRNKLDGTEMLQDMYKDLLIHSSSVEEFENLVAAKWQEYRDRPLVFKDAKAPTMRIEEKKYSRATSDLPVASILSESKSSDELKGQVLAPMPRESTWRESSQDDQSIVAAGVVLRPSELKQDTMSSTPSVEALAVARRPQPPTPSKRNSHLGLPGRPISRPTSRPGARSRSLTPRSRQNATVTGSVRNYSSSESSEEESKRGKNQERKTTDGKSDSKSAPTGLQSANSNRSRRRGRHRRYGADGSPLI